MTGEPIVIPAVLGWRNPDDDGKSLRLYALDRGSSPRWDRQSSPTGRTIECALVSTDPREYGRGEGDRYLVVRLGDRFTSPEAADRIAARIEHLLDDAEEDE
jgi:hypothetical protein